MDDIESLAGRLARLEKQYAELYQSQCALIGKVMAYAGEVEACVSSIEDTLCELHKLAPSSSGRLLN